MNYNTITFQDDTIYFHGFELLKTHVAVPHGKGENFSLRCCLKEEAVPGSFIEVTEQHVISPLLLTYFKKHRAFGYRYILVGGNTYVKTVIPADER
jgi:hypothetical protein